MEIFRLLIARRQGDIMTVKRMDNVGIVVEDIDAACGRRSPQRPGERSRLPTRPVH